MNTMQIKESDLKKSLLMLDKEVLVNRILFLMKKKGTNKKVFKNDNKKAKFIMEQVSVYLDIPIKEIKGRSRKREIVYSRQLSMRLLWEFTELSLSSIGRLFGSRDHSTVIHAREKIEMYSESKLNMYRFQRETYEEIKEKIKSVIAL